MGADLETTTLLFLKLFMALQCHKMKFLWKLLVQAIYLLDKRNQKISTLLPAGKNFTNLFWAELESTIKFLAKILMALQCHKMKFQSNVLVQTMSLLYKTNK